VIRSGEGRAVTWPDAYTLAGICLFLVTAVGEWRDYIRKHEAIYLLGSRRIADPEFLANDFTWSSVPPTSYLFDHLLAPMWAILGEPGIVLAGRLVTWLLFSGSLAMLSRGLRLPPWSVVAGLALWLLWDQTIAACGRPLEGFQPKSFAYPFAFFSLALAIRGNMLRAGVAAGLAIAFHIIIGGWSTVAITASMLVNRSLFTPRAIGRFMLGVTPFALPTVIAAGRFYSGGAGGPESAAMDHIYVTFSQPHCVDPTFFLTTDVWRRALGIFPMSVLLLLIWPQRRAAKIVMAYLAMIVALFGAGWLASRFEFNALLKLYPFQLANALPALFLFIITLASCGHARPRDWPGRTLWVVSGLVCLGLLLEAGVFTGRAVAAGAKFLDSLDWREPVRYGESVSDDELALYAWIRERTPRDSVFVTPYLPEFWTYAERAQVASFRHPPHDRRLVEWHRRLEAINGSRPFVNRGFDIEREFNFNERRLTAVQILELARRYGATYYLVADPGHRLPWRDMPWPRVYAAGAYAVYDLKKGALAIRNES
jgi:hypothetical protein